MWKGSVVARTITLVHDEGGFDLVKAEDLGKQKSLGTRTVLTPEGEQERHKVASADVTSTTIELPEDYVGEPQELVHLVQTLTDRHAPETNIVVVSGDSAVGPKLAALLGATFTEGDGQ